MHNVDNRCGCCWLLSSGRRSLEGHPFHGKTLIVIHEVSDLGIGIGEIKLEITDVAEIFEDLNEGFLAIFLLDPIPDLLGSLVLALLPDTDVKGDREQAFGFGIVLIHQEKAT